MNLKEPICAMTDTEIADALEKAADIVHVKGLAKYALEDEEGRVCARGAIFKALTGHANVTQALSISDFERVEGTMVKHLGLGWETIPVWNNVPERTQFEVEEAFRGAAKDLRNSTKEQS